MLEKQISEAKEKEDNLGKELKKEEKNLTELNKLVKADESCNRKRTWNKAFFSFDKKPVASKRNSYLEKKEVNFDLQVLARSSRRENDFFLPLLKQNFSLERGKRRQICQYLPETLRVNISKKWMGNVNFLSMQG